MTPTPTLPLQGEGERAPCRARLSPPPSPGPSPPRRGRISSAMHRPRARPWRCGGRSGRRDRRRRLRRDALTPMPIRRKRVAPISCLSRSRPAAKMRAASCVGAPSERARVRILKSAVLSLSVTVEPAKPLRLQPRRHLLAQLPEMLLERAEVADVARRRSSRPTRSWSRARDRHARSSMPRAAAHRRKPSSP